MRATANMAVSGEGTRGDGGDAPGTPVHRVGRERPSTMATGFRNGRSCLRRTTSASVPELPHTRMPMRCGRPARRPPREARHDLAAREHEWCREPERTAVSRRRYRRLSRPRLSPRRGRRSPASLGECQGRRSSAREPEPDCACDAGRHVTRLTGDGDGKVIRRRVDRSRLDADRSPRQVRVGRAGRRPPRPPPVTRRCSRLLRHQRAAFPRSPETGRSIALVDRSFG